MYSVDKLGTRGPRSGGRSRCEQTARGEGAVETDGGEEKITAATVSKHLEKMKGGNPQLMAPDG